VLRARIMLACLEGKEMQQVARERKVSVPSVSKWRQRFARWGVRGLRDRARPGKPVSSMMLLSATAPWEQTPPPGRSHGDGPAVAEKLGASVPAVWRVLRREGIYLQRRRSGCVSTGQQFAPKAADVVALYGNPPINAVVWSVEEKPSLQAIERASGYVKTDSGQVVRALKSTYQRHGTLSLFAALEVGTKSTASSPHPRSGRSLAVFWRTCWPISRRIGIHVIVDHSSPPKRNDDWLAGLAQFQGRVRLHFTPTSASWLNQMEIVFRLLQPKTLHGGNLKSQDPLREAIEAFLRKHHERARPFRWRKREVSTASGAAGLNRV